MTVTTLRPSIIAAALAAVVLVGCKPNPERRELQFMPDMYESPSLKSQEESTFFKTGSSNQMPPANTEPRNFQHYPFTIVEAEKARALENPLPRTKEVLDIGRKYYNIHCMICHGAVGAGDGLATQVHREAGMPIPPSLYSDKIKKEWNDGILFHTITMGQGQMPGYGSRITDVHRWAIVHYVRVLGEASSPTEEALQEVERRGLEAKKLDIPFNDPNYQQGRYLISN
jgi:mono/diheme cytochrome c family protein